MAARAERYEFFVRAAEHFDTTILATGHTADDQAETVLLKLARGSGIDGLSGVSRKSWRSGLCLIRPLLDVTRRELVEFLNESNQEWREDLSNSDVSFLRNRVRHDLLPWMKNNLNVSIKETLCRTAGILRDESAWLESLCRELLYSYLDTDGVVDVVGLSSEPVAARRRVLRIWFSYSGIDGNEISYKMIEQADELLCRDNDGSCSVQLPHGYMLTRQYDRMILETSGERIEPVAFRKNLVVPGETIIPDQSLRVTVEVGMGVIRKKTTMAGDLPAKASISTTAIGDNPIYIRSWTAGDRMQPLGIEGSQKLQDIFVNEKVPVKQRGLVPIVECLGEIIWIPNFRVARGWEVLPHDESSVHISIERI